jgi:hypothetical protein
MRFRAVQTNAVMMNSSIVYRPKEFSFDVIPPPLRGFTSILLDDLNLEVDETGKVISVWGMCPHTRWKESVLAPPEAVPGELFVLPDEPFRRAVSVRLTPDRHYSPTYVDRSLGWVKIEGAFKPDAALEIIPGVIFQLGEQGEFSALWLHPHSGITR